MHSHEVALLRGAGFPAAVVTAAAAVLFGVVAGHRGAAGALAGGIVVASFFGSGLIVSSWSRTSAPAVVTGAAVATYAVQISALAAVLVFFGDMTLLDTRAFAVTILVVAVAWLAALMRAFTRLPILYVDPEDSHR